MKIAVDTSANAAYVYVSEEPPVTGIVAKTVVLSDFLYVDLDSSGLVWGVEVFARNGLFMISDPDLAALVEDYGLTVDQVDEIKQLLLF